MGTAMVDKVVSERVTVCDICGNPIYEDKDDSAATTEIAFLHGKVDAPLDRIKRVKFSWPTAKMFDRQGEERRKARVSGEIAEPIQYRTHYDFHGECIANLVEAAVQMRKKEEEEARRAE